MEPFLILGFIAQKSIPNKINSLEKLLFKGVTDGNFFTLYLNELLLNNFDFIHSDNI